MDKMRRRRGGNWRHKKWRRKETERRRDVRGTGKEKGSDK